MHVLVINRIDCCGLHVEAERWPISVVGAFEVPDEKCEDQIWIGIGKSEEIIHFIVTKIVQFKSYTSYFQFFAEQNSYN